MDNRTKNKKLIPAIVSLLIVVCAIAAAAPIYGWFAPRPEGIVVVLGDVEIDTKGWYKVLQLDEIDPDAAYKDFNDVDDQLPDDMTTAIKGLNYSQVIAFKFEITNRSDRSAGLSLRFNPFIDTAFENFDAYFAADGVVPQGGALAREIATSAEKNTFKFVYNIANLWCEYYDEQNQWKSEQAEDSGLWQYSAGEYVFDDVWLRAKSGGIESPAYIYFIFANSQDPTVIERYRNWLCGVPAENDTPAVIGYGQDLCARKLGYAWDVLPAAQKSLVDSYLAYFVEQETRSVRPGEAGLSIVNFDLKYFEFTCSVGTRG